MIEGKEQPHSVWLCPSGQAGTALDTLIADAAHAQGVSAFAAHVTLLGDLFGDPARTVGACHEVFADLGAVRATVTDVVRTDAHFMSLFLDLDLEPDLDRHRAALGARLGADAGPFRPHISLAYGLPPAAAGAERRAALRARFDGQILDLSGLCIAASAQDMPIADWRILHHIPLGAE